MILGAFVLWKVLTDNADMTFLSMSLAAAFFLSLVVLIDYHWSTVVRFYAKYPSQRKGKINWLESDSEPDFAFERNNGKKVNNTL
jgi:uncharacterized membrane protein YdfJ with MMPL/SSD domain